MTTPENIRTVAHLLAGHEAGWQTRFANIIGISRGYAHNLLTGERPLNQLVTVKIIEAADRQAAAFLERAAALRGARALVLPDPSGPFTLPPMTDDQYQREASEAEAIINEMAGVAGNAPVKGEV